jgi:hypothetical protein
VSGAVGLTADNNVVEDTGVATNVVGGGQVAGATVVVATATVVGGTDSPSSAVLVEVDGSGAGVNKTCTAAGKVVPLHSGTASRVVVVVANEVPEASGCLVLEITVDVLTALVVVVVAKLSGAHSSTTCVVVVTAASVVDTISATTVDGFDVAGGLVVGALSATTEFGEVVVANPGLVVANPGLVVAVVVAVVVTVVVTVAGFVVSELKGTAVEDGVGDPGLGAVELETAGPSSLVVTGTELDDSDDKVVVVDWARFGNVIEVSGTGATVELGASAACAASMGADDATVVLAWLLTSATGTVELGGVVVEFAISVDGLEVVVVALPADGKVEGLCVELGDSVEEGATLEVRRVGTDCPVATLLLGAARAAPVDVVTRAEADESGSRQGNATVTESWISAPLPSETLH